MRAVFLMLKDLSQVLKDWKSAVFLVLMPLAFTLFFGFLVSGNFAETRVRVGWLNQDGPGLAESLRGLLESAPDLVLVEAGAGGQEPSEALVRNGKLAALVIVPAGFGASGLAGAPPPLRVVAQPGRPEGRVATTAVQSAARRLLGAVQAARMSLEAAQASGAVGSGEAEAFVREGFSRALEAWAAPGLAVRAETSGPAQAAVSAGRSLGFLQASPGMIVQFAIYGLFGSAMLLVLERKSRALARLLSAPLTRASIIGGHLAAMFVLVLLQELILIACGQLLFHVDYLRSPGGSLLMMVALALWAASLGLLIGSLARKEQQVIIYALAAMFAFSALGGAWFPLEVAGRGFASFGRWTPAAWAMEGFQNIVLRGLGTSSAFLPAGMLLGYAAVCFALAVWRFRF